MKQQSTSDQNSPSFTRCVIFFNPNSTHALAAKRRIEELKEILKGCEFEIIETLPEGRQANTKLLVSQSKVLGPHTLLCIAAGDGTTNTIIEALITADGLGDKARKTPVLPLWGGNANDLAHMLNGPAYKTKLKDIITKGHVVPIHPLHCEMVNRRRKETKVRLAACYASFGATAFAARSLNRPAHRKSRLHAVPGGRILQEIITVLGALVEAPSFSVKESGNVKVVYERTFANGSRMGKLERLPVKLTDEMFYLNTLEDKKLVSVIPRLIDSTRKRMSENFLGNYASFTTQEESWAQFDGEALRIPAHTKVHVQLSPRPFYALSLALKTPPKK